MTGSRAIVWTGFVIGIVALVWQFALTIPASMAAERSFWMSVVYFFSFLTILSNIALVLVHAGTLFRARWLSGLRTPLARGSVASVIALVMVYYHFFLASDFDLQGPALYCDILLHYVTPVIYLVWFIGFARSGTLRMRHIPAMLLFPVVYLLYALARGAIVGEYPYPVIDAGRIGYAQLGINALFLLLVLSVLNAVAIGIDNFKPQPRVAG